MNQIEIPRGLDKGFKPAKEYEKMFISPNWRLKAAMRPLKIEDDFGFNVIGRGFIFPKHQEAIEANGGAVRDFWYDWVVILTESFNHIDQIKKNCKKPILCEKPLIIKKEDMDFLDGVPELFTCLQLRYLDLNFEKSEFDKINIDIRTKRDKEYFESWKGNPEKSGGILLNIAIHYFDLLFHHFGFPEKMEVKCCKLTDRFAEGMFMSKTFQADWRFEMGEDIKEKRLFQVNKKKYDLSTKENLYVPLYRDLLADKGISWLDVKKLYQLIFHLQENVGENYTNF